MRAFIKITALFLSLIILIGVMGGCNKKEGGKDGAAIEVSFSVEYSPAPINASVQNKNYFTPYILRQLITLLFLI